MKSLAHLHIIGALGHSTEFIEKHPNTAMINHYLDKHSKKILKVDRARRKEVAVKVRVKKDYSFRNEVRNLSAVALIIND